MPESESILTVLDEFAERFEFPGFNNMNYVCADSRLHCFRDAARWALVIEELVDWPSGDGLTTIIFAMGEIRGEHLSTRSPITPPLDRASLSCCNSFDRIATRCSARATRSPRESPSVSRRFSRSTSGRTRTFMAGRNRASRRRSGSSPKRWRRVTSAGTRRPRRRTAVIGGCGARVADRSR
jgi:hypothetical protein